MKIRSSLLLAGMVALSGCGTGPASNPAATADATPATTPAAPAVLAGGAVVVAGGLEQPWSLAFLPDGRMLVTERPGRLRIVQPDGTVSAPLGGVPAVVAEGQGGLLDVVLSPTFAQDGLVYLSYAEPGEGDLAGTAVARARLEGETLTGLEVVFRQTPKLATRHHFGSRLVFDRAGHLFISLGDRGERPMAQQTGNHVGTLVRIHPDGRVPEDNPFVGRDDVRPEIWSYGHRNQQGAALNPWTGAVWTHEHGPMGGDEINIPVAGGNYGWPIATHGINYSGTPIPEARGRFVDGTLPPHFVWERSPGVSGMAFYDHPRSAAWQRSLFVGAMAQTALIRLTLDGDTVTEAERLLGDLRARIRDVRVGPDGAVYLLTDAADGQLLRLDPPDAAPAPSARG